LRAGYTCPQYPENELLHKARCALSQEEYFEQKINRNSHVIAYRVVSALQRVQQFVQ